MYIYKEIQIKYFDSEGQQAKKRHVLMQLCHPIQFQGVYGSVSRVRYIFFVQDQKSSSLFSSAYRNHQRFNLELENVS